MTLQELVEINWGSGFAWDLLEGEELVMGPAPVAPYYFVTRVAAHSPEHPEKEDDFFRLYYLQQEEADHGLRKNMIVTDDYAGFDSLYEAVKESVILQYETHLKETEGSDT